MNFSKGYLVCSPQIVGIFIYGAGCDRFILFIICTGGDVDTLLCLLYETVTKIGGHSGDSMGDTTCPCIDEVFFGKVAIYTPNLEYPFDKNS